MQRWPDEVRESSAVAIGDRIRGMIARLALVLLLGAGLFVTGAAGSPLLWTLSNVSFTDGGAASGSFVFDADTSVFSAINITTTRGTSLGGSIYLFPDTGAGVYLNAAELMVLGSNSANLSGSPFLEMDFNLNGMLTDSGGTIDVTFLHEGVCANATCGGVGAFGTPLLRAGSQTGDQIDGTASAQAAAPEPSAVSLTGIGFGAIALILTARRTGGRKTSFPLCRTDFAGVWSGRAG